MKNNTQLIRFFVFCCAFMLSSLSWALEPMVKSPQVDTPKRLLMIGNSYLYYGDSLHNLLRGMVIAGQPEIKQSLQYKSATIGGASLDHHNIDWPNKAWSNRG